MTKVSVAIPAYEYYGRGVEFLDDMFRTISQQTLKEVQVVVSDHSKTDEIQEYCDFNEYGLNIKYIRNEEFRGSPAHNTNCAIDNCDGEIVKIFQQDDFFYDTEALEKMYDAFQQFDQKWLVCGAIHTRDDGNTFFNPMFPRWSDYMILEKGNNYIGGLSVTAFRNKDVNIRLDSNTIMLLDVDFYYNLMVNYGHPVYYNDLLICNRVRDHDTLMATVSDEDIDKEFQYCHQKYGITL